MATLTKAAAYHTAISTGYTNPANAYSDNEVYATAAPAKNGQVSAYFGFPAFSPAEIPDGSTINSVTVGIQFKVSTASSVATQYAQACLGTSVLDSEQSNAAEPTADTNLTHTVTSGISVDDLRTADNLRLRSRSARGNSNTGVTFSVDYVWVTVDYTEPLPTHDLTVNELTLGAPVLGAPALTQDIVHALDVEELAAGAPVLGRPTLGQVHVLEALGLVAGAVELGAPALTLGKPIAEEDIRGFVTDRARLVLARGEDRQAAVLARPRGSSSLAPGREASSLAPNRKRTVTHA